MMASLDHTIWFHSAFRADEWLLYVLDSSRAQNGRGLSYGKIFDAAGTLVVSVAQVGKKIKDINCVAHELRRG